MTYWKIRITAWPFNTGKGREEELRVAGPEERYFIVTAGDFNDACIAASHIKSGIVSSGHIWVAKINEVVSLGEAWKGPTGCITPEQAKAVNRVPDRGTGEA